MKKSELRQIIKEELNKLNESETFKYKGISYKIDIVKSPEKREGGSPNYHLILTNITTGEIAAWPGVFWYEVGWTQGTNKSEKMWFLNTKEYGGVSQGSGVHSPVTPSPRFIKRQLEFILKNMEDEYYKWFKNHTIKYPKGTKKSEIVNDLNSKMYF